MITKLTGKGKNWPLFIGCTCYAYNTSPHRLLKGYSPFELLFGRKPKDPLNLDSDILEEPIPPTISEYVISLKEKLAEVGQIATELHNKHQLSQSIDRAREINRKPMFHVGDLVYLLFPKATQLQTGTLKFRSNYIGPLVVSSVLDERLVTLTDLSGKAVYGVHSIKRLKRAYFKVKHKNATNITDIQEAIKILDDARKKNPDLVETLSDSPSTDKGDLNAHLMPADNSGTLSSDCKSTLVNHYPDSNLDAILRL